MFVRSSNSMRLKQAHTDGGSEAASSAQQQVERTAQVFLLLNSEPEPEPAAGQASTLLLLALALAQESAERTNNTAQAAARSSLRVRVS